MSGALAMAGPLQRPPERGRDVASGNSHGLGDERVAFAQVPFGRLGHAAVGETRPDDDRLRLPVAQNPDDAAVTPAARGPGGGLGRRPGAPGGGWDTVGCVLLGR